MDFTGTTALVTGANRGLGRHLLDALLDRGVRRVYAAARDTSSLAGLGERVVPLRLDLTDPDRIATAAAQATDVTLLINNASVAAFADPFSADREAVALEMTTTGIDGPRTAPRQVADGILAGIEKGEEDIFPDPISQSLSPTWFSDPKAYELAFSGR